MEGISRKYKTQTFVCTNERPPGRVCCAQVKGQDFFMKLKTKMKEEGLYAQNLVTRTGCMGYCNAVGTVLVIYREGQEPKWYQKVTEEDFSTIWEEIVSS